MITLQSGVGLALRQNEKLHQYCEGAEYAFNHLSEEMGVDMQGLMNRAIDALHRTPFYQHYEQQPETNLVATDSDLFPISSMPQIHPYLLFLDR